MRLIVLDGSKGREWITICDAHWAEAELVLKKDSTCLYEAVVIPPAYTTTFSCEICTVQKGWLLEQAFVADA